MRRARWMSLATLLLSACLPGASVLDGGHRICPATCPFYYCPSCSGGLFSRASTCLESCSDESATCTSLCSDTPAPKEGSQKHIWAATQTVGAAQFFGASDSDSNARKAAWDQCTKASVSIGGCSSGDSAIELEPEIAVTCTGSFSSGADTFSYEARSYLGRTDAKALTVTMCLFAKKVLGQGCGLGQFSCK